MPDSQHPSSDESLDRPLRTCPDCGGILEPTQPGWTMMVNMVAGPGEVTTGGPSPTPGETDWRCLLCGYRD